MNSTRVKNVSLKTKALRYLGYGLLALSWQTYIQDNFANVPTLGERLKKKCSRSAARDFGVLARLSEGACPQRPVTERKRGQNPKRSAVSLSTGRLQFF
jgi:hypothetical protein